MPSAPIQRDTSGWEHEVPHSILRFYVEPQDDGRYRIMARDGYSPNWNLTRPDAMKMCAEFNKYCGAWKGCLHFIGFRGEEYWSAVKVWGLPDFYHRVWDMRAQREIADGDVCVFAKYDPTRPSPYNFDDSNEDDDPAAQERKRGGHAKLVLQNRALPILR